MWASSASLGDHITDLAPIPSSGMSPGVAAPGQGGDLRLSLPHGDHPAIVDRWPKGLFDHFGSAADELRNEFGRALLF
jgi:hypothetical protein